MLPRWQKQTEVVDDADQVYSANYRVNSMVQNGN